MKIPNGLLGVGILAAIALGGYSIQQNNHIINQQNIMAEELTTVSVGVGEIKDLLASGPGPGGPITIINPTQFNTYRDYYRTWLGGRDAHTILAYNISEVLVDAIELQMASPHADQEGVRGYYVLTSSYSSGVDSAMEDMHIVVVPTDAEGRDLPSADLVMAKLPRAYSRPCPEICD